MAKKPRTDIWMPVFIGDHLAETMHLNAAQHGGYFLLLMAAWRAGGSLPDSDARLAAIARMSPAEWEQNRDTLAAFFTVADGAWRHESLTDEYERATNNKQKHSASGSKGAAKRWQTDGPSPSPSPSSEAKASGTDVAAVVFSQGLDWLKQTSGKSDTACRVLLGKWRKTLGSDEALIAILGRAQREGVIEPVGWIEKALQARDPPTPNRNFN
jgi:uncharacterized protein YdaU (DUF1376 family)